MNGPEISPGSSPSSVEQQLDSLRKLFVVTLIILLGFAGAVDLYLARQLANVRSAVDQTSGIVTQFTKNELPNIQTFTTSLQTYAKTHPDINPVLAKYPSFFPPANSAPTPAPAKSK